MRWSMQIVILSFKIGVKMQKFSHVKVKYFFISGDLPIVLTVEWLICFEHICSPILSWAFKLTNHALTTPRYRFIIKNIRPTRFIHDFFGWGWHMDNAIQYCCTCEQETSVNKIYVYPRNISSCQRHLYPLCCYLYKVLPRWEQSKAKHLRKLSCHNV